MRQRIQYPYTELQMRSRSVAKNCFADVLIDRGKKMENKEDKMKDLQKELLQVEADRAAGKPGCTLDELDKYLDNILEE